MAAGSAKPRGSGSRGSAASRDELSSVPSGTLPRRYNQELKTNLNEAYRGRRRLTLMRDIAMGEFSDQEISEMYGVRPKDIQAFSEEFAEEITEIRQAMAGKLSIETAGLWISKKQNRLAELQAGVEQIDSMIEDDPLITTRRFAALTRLKVTLLRAAADEMQPRKSDKGDDAEQGQVVKYIIEGEDMQGVLT